MEISIKKDIDVNSPSNQLLLMIINSVYKDTEWIRNFDIDIGYLLHLKDGITMQTPELLHKQITLY